VATHRCRMVATAALASLVAFDQAPLFADASLAARKVGQLRPQSLRVAAHCQQLSALLPRLGAIDWALLCITGRWMPSRRLVACVAVTPIRVVAAGASVFVTGTCASLLGCILAGRGVQACAGLAPILPECARASSARRRPRTDEARRRSPAPLPALCRISAYARCTTTGYGLYPRCSGPGGGERLRVMIASLRRTPTRRERTAPRRTAFDTGGAQAPDIGAPRRRVCYSSTVPVKRSRRAQLAARRSEGSPRPRACNAEVETRTTDLPVFLIQDEVAWLDVRE